jgi:hypothetical protein
MRAFLRLTAILAVLAATSGPALSQAEDIAFADGTIRIEETAEYDKIISFDGREIGRYHMVFFDRIVDVGGTDVALISVGPGGNACGANTLMVWMDDNGDLKTDQLPGDCGWPAPAVSDFQIVFVPWVGPGDELPVRSWTPEAGFSMAGTLRFAAEPGTGWTDLAADPAIYPVDYFYNEAFLAHASAILGGELQEYATGLSVASEMKEIGDGLYAETGCVPHDCGGADSLLVVDFNLRTAWFAQKRGNAVAHWPDLSDWPAPALDAATGLGAF